MSIRLREGVTIDYLGVQMLIVLVRTKVPASGFLTMLPPMGVWAQYVDGRGIIRTHHWSLDMLPALEALYGSASPDTGQGGDA